MKNKILILGDTHGRTIWKDILDVEQPDLTIFLGDYGTTHEGISAIDQITNLEDILKYKEDHSDSVILLRGNHDGQLLGYSWAECSPREPKVQEYMSKPEFREYFLRNTQWIYIDDDLRIIFSHAGISDVWMLNSHIDNVHDINKLIPSEIFGFTPNSFWDGYGTSPTQPPTWIRPQTLAECNIEGWHQVIGHTPQNNITKISGKEEEEIWLCDTLGVRQYLTIDNGIFNIKHLD